MRLIQHQFLNPKKRIVIAKNQNLFFFLIPIHPKTTMKKTNDYIQIKSCTICKYFPILQLYNEPKIFVF